MEVVLEALRQQCGACLAMLRQAVTKCPDTVWDTDEESPRFWENAYHAAAFFDFYAATSPESFQPALGTRDMCRFSEMPATPFSKLEVLDYIDRVAALLEVGLARVASEGLDATHPFHWTGPTNVDLWLYSLRHTQHHVGQLNAALARCSGIHGEWVCAEALLPRTAPKG